MKKILISLVALFVALLLSSCSEKPSAASLDVQFRIPSKVSINYDESELEFQIMFGKAPLETDQVVLADEAGAFRSCNIISVGEASFTIALYKNFTSGVYNVYFQRGDYRKLMGTMTLQVTYNESGFDIDVKEGNSVYGVVMCDGKGVEGVVISDGYEFAVTDSEGIYQFRSLKKHGYVFMSVPSGYEAKSDGVFPRFHAQLSGDPGVPERADFYLTEAPGQESHTMLVFGDMHLAARTSDAIQFADFTYDVNNFVASNSGKRTYALTLGDMTWEYYWYRNSYALNEYVRDINALEGLQVFHTIGNHDHDMKFAGDFDTVTKYKRIIAPTYYSFNVGKVHYVVLDNIKCMNKGGTETDGGTRDYEDLVVQEQLDWLRKDLEYVSKSTPIFITMHSPLYNDSENGKLNNTSAFESVLEGYTNVHIWSGHTHEMYNVDKMSSKNIFEHNAGAVCATWWWTGHFNSGMHIATDGAPGGYSIVDINGENIKWQFKGTGKKINHQFRSYDRNSIALTAEKYASKESDWGKLVFISSVGDWLNSSSSNYVYINVWNYDPLWNIEVKEDGKVLKVERVTVKDPLHLIAYNANNPEGGFGTTETKHMFKVQASSATSTLEIKVTDRFGNVYTESMKRPKAFSIDAYK